MTTTDPAPWNDPEGLLADVLRDIEKSLAATSDADHWAKIEESLRRAGVQSAVDEPAPAGLDLPGDGRTSADDFVGAMALAYDVPDFPPPLLDLTHAPADSLGTSPVLGMHVELPAMWGVGAAKLERDLAVQEAVRAREAADWALRDAAKIRREAENLRAEAEKRLADAKYDAQRYRDVSMTRAARRQKAAHRLALLWLRKASTDAKRIREAAEAYSARIRDAAEADAENVRYVAGEFANAVVAAAASTLTDETSDGSAADTVFCVQVQPSTDGSIQSRTGLTETLARLHAATRARDGARARLALDQLLMNDLAGDGAWFVRQVIAAGLRAAADKDRSPVDIHSIARQHERVLAAPGVTLLDVATRFRPDPVASDLNHAADDVTRGGDPAVTSYRFQTTERPPSIAEPPQAQPAGDCDVADGTTDDRDLVQHIIAACESTGPVRVAAVSTRGRESLAIAVVLLIEPGPASHRTARPGERAPEQACPSGRRGVGSAASRLDTPRPRQAARGFAPRRRPPHARSPRRAGSATTAGWGLSVLLAALLGLALVPAVTRQVRTTSPVALSWVAPFLDFREWMAPAGSLVSVVGLGFAVLWLIALAVRRGWTTPATRRLCDLTRTLDLLSKVEQLANFWRACVFSMRPERAPFTHDRS